MIRKTLKALYEAIPGKQPAFQILKIFGTPPESIFRHLHFKGDFQIKIDNNHSLKMRSDGFRLENEIFWGGLYYRYEKNSFKLWTELSKHSAIIFDIGANSGIYSLIAKAMNASSVVYAFEPVQRVFKKLRYNIDLNGFNVVSVQKAASNTNGSALIFDSNDPHEFAASLERNVFGDKGFQTEIETETLAHYIEQNNITGIDLMKIDVELHEREVLEGMGKYLERFRPTLLIEIVDERLAEKIEALVRSCGYLYFDIDEMNGYTLKPHLKRSSSNNWLLCSPKIASLLNLPLKI